MSETPLTLCPQCAAAVPSQAFTCPQCGANLALLRTFRDMQQDVQQCEEHVTALQGQLSTLQEKFTRVAALLATQPADHGSTAAAPHPEWRRLHRRPAWRPQHRAREETHCHQPCRRRPDLVHSGTRKSILASAGCWLAVSP